MARETNRRTIADKLSADLCGTVAPRSGRFEFPDFDGFVSAPKDFQGQMSSPPAWMTRRIGG
jgi:hypothetical protein